MGPWPWQEGRIFPSTPWFPSFPCCVVMDRFSPSCKQSLFHPIPSCGAKKTVPKIPYGRGDSSVISLQVIVPDLPPSSSLSLGLSNTKDHASLGTGRGAPVHMAELWVPCQPLPTALHAGPTWDSGTSVSLLVNVLKLLDEKSLIFPFLQHQRQGSERSGVAEWQCCWGQSLNWQCWGCSRLCSSGDGQGQCSRTLAICSCSRQITFWRPLTTWIFK